MNIKKLDSDVISKIRSSFNINSVAECVFELVCNSLDAKSTSVAVRINLITFKLQVADNGVGITKDNMELLGVRYATSKCQRLKDLERNHKTYGFRGETIASLVEICKSISISSRARSTSDTYSKELSRDLRSEVNLVKPRASVGTTVTVLGWFDTLPVRQQRLVPEIELEEVKKQLESLVIINPATSFTLRNDVTGLLILNSPKNPDIVGSFRHLHPEISDSFSLIKVAKNKVSIEMLIHKDPILSKKYQYVYVNKRPVRSPRILKSVYKAFCTKNQTKNPLLYQTKRYPVYVMNIKCPHSYVDGLIARWGVEFTCWDLVLACVDKSIRTFLGLGEGRQEAPAVSRKTREKFSCGVSQLLGTVQASAFKRKSDETMPDEDDDSGEVARSVCKIRRVEAEDGNYQIEDSGKQPDFNKPRNVKLRIKKPLAIKVKPITVEKTSNGEGVPAMGNDDGAGAKAQQNQFDQRSVYSRLNSEEDRGKELIMDMFLKSTQVFKGDSEETFEQPRQNDSKETIEESNFLFENNIQDTVKGINTTMSISVNVKKRRLKNWDGKLSKCVQTSVIGDKLASKSVQTSLGGLGGWRGVVGGQKLERVAKTSQRGILIAPGLCGFPAPDTGLNLNQVEPELKGSALESARTSRNPGWSRQKSYQTDLASRFHGCTLDPKSVEEVKDNYTILIGTVRKKREYIFVRKSEEMEEDKENEPFRPLKICHCNDKTEENIFKFREAESDNRHDKEIVKNEFRKPIGPVLKPKPITKVPNIVNGQVLQQNNVLFRGITKHPPPKTPTRPLYGKSPYFSKKSIVQLDANRAFENFRPMFKSTQISRDTFQGNHVKSPFFTKIPPEITFSSNFQELNRDQLPEAKPHHPYMRNVCCDCNFNGKMLAHHKNQFYHLDLNRNQPDPVIFSHTNGIQSHHSEPKMIEFNKRREAEQHLPSNIVHKNLGCHLQRGKTCCLHQNQKNNNCTIVNQTGYVNTHKNCWHQDNILPREENGCLRKSPQINELRDHTHPSDDDQVINLVSHEHLSFGPSVVDENIDIVDEIGEAPKENMFNFNLRYSPDLFSGEVPKIPQDNHGNVEADPKECTFSPNGDLKSSNLEISLPQDGEEQVMVENELLELKNNNFLSCCHTEENLISKSQSKYDERSRIIIDSQNEWLRQCNEEGRKFFVNKRTGMVTAQTPVPLQINFDFDQRLDFVPKGMSPVLQGHKKVDRTLSQRAKSKLHRLILEGYEDELMVIKWCNFIGDDPKTFFQQIYMEKSKNFEPCIPNIHEGDLKMSKNFVSFSCKTFGSMEIIGQVDKKFIAVWESTGDLILFDQHAVHERIRVEQFLMEYKGAKRPCKQKLTMFLPHNDLALLKKHFAYIDSLGLGLEFFSNGLHITDVPLSIHEKFSAEVNTEDLNNILTMLIKDLVEFLKYTRGSATKLMMPKIIQNIINLKACRGAIKFGDRLSTGECEKLLKDLARCKLPFQCAHGRPTLTPILTLSKVQNRVKVKKLDLKKLLVPSKIP